jgi:hypothetical protein
MVNKLSSKKPKERLKTGMTVDELRIGKVRMVTLALSPGLALIVFSFLHRLQLNSDGYTTSILILFEMGLALLMLILIVVQPLRGLYFLIRQRWRNLAFAFLWMIFYLVCLIIAQIIDAPTLVYMT